MTSVYTGASVIASVFSTSNTVLLRGNKRFYLTEYIEVSPWYFEKKMAVHSFLLLQLLLQRLHWPLGVWEREKEKKKQEKKGKELSVSLPFLPPFSQPFYKRGQWYLRRMLGHAKVCWSRTRLTHKSSWGMPALSTTMEANREKEEPRTSRDQK